LLLFDKRWELIPTALERTNSHKQIIFIGGESWAEGSKSSADERESFATVEHAGSAEQ